MAINFPTSLDSLTNPTGSDNLNSPDHAGQHSDINDAVEALETKVGIDGSADTDSIDYKLSLLHHDINTIHVDPAGSTDYATIASAITYLGTLSTTDGWIIRLSGGDHEVTDTVIIDLTMPIMIMGSGSNNTNICAATGLLNKNMFVIRSDTDFERVYFQGSTLPGWKAGTEASFVKLDTDGVYCELQNFWMEGANKGVEITASAEIYSFNYEIADCDYGCDINAAGKNPDIDFEVGNMTNCTTSFNFAAAASGKVYISSLRFLNEVGNTCVVYNGTNFVYDTLTFNGCEWNQVGTSQTGFDFTIARDADIEISGNIGYPDMTPIANISCVNNGSDTVVSSSTWTKATFTNTSSTAIKFGIADNRFTYLPTMSRNLMFLISGSLTVASTGIYTILYGIVKNGNTTPIYGQQTVTCDQNSRRFTFSDNVTINNVAQNDYFEFWIQNSGSGVDPRLTDINMIVYSFGK